MSINRNDHTFRLAFVRRKVRTTFKSQAVRTALLDELNTRGPDSEVIVRMIERIPTSRSAVVQPVEPTPQIAQTAAGQPMPAPLAAVQSMPVQPTVVQPLPAQVAVVQPNSVQPEYIVVIHILLYRILLLSEYCCNKRKLDFHTLSEP